MKKKTLKRFNFLCEDIENNLASSTETNDNNASNASNIDISKVKEREEAGDETTAKKSSNWAKKLTYKRYISEDFDRLWSESALPKLIKRLDDVLNNNNPRNTVDFDNFLDLSSKTFTDLPPGSMSGSANAPVIKLTYDIEKSERYNLLKTVMLRSENNEETAISKFGIWQVPLQEKLSEGEVGKNSISPELDIDLKLEILSYPTTRDGKSQDFSKNEKINTFNEGGFECKIYLWFDSIPLKKQLTDVLKNSDINVNGGREEDSRVDNSDVGEDLNAELDKLNDNNSKILLGTAKIKLGNRLEGTISKIAKGLVTYRLAADTAIAGFKRMFNIGDLKDSSEEPDKIKIYKTGESIPAALMNIGNPYIECFSVITLSTWLYDTIYDKELTSGKDKPKNMTAIYHYKFSEDNLKLDVTKAIKFSDLSNNNLWSAGALYASNYWSPIAIDAGELKKGQIDAITCRIQYYTDSSHNFYFEYRSTIPLKDWLDICGEVKEKLDSLFDDENHWIRFLKMEITNKLNQRDTNSVENHVIDYIRHNKYRVKKCDSAYESDDVSTFHNWWRNRFIKENEMGPNKRYPHLQCISQKHLFTNKNKTFLTNSSDTLRRTFKLWRTYDASAFNFFERNLFNNQIELTCGGTSLDDILTLPQVDDTIKAQFEKLEKRAKIELFRKKHKQASDKDAKDDANQGKPTDTQVDDDQIKPDTAVSTVEKPNDGKK